MSGLTNFSFPSHLSLFQYYCPIAKSDQDSYTTDPPAPPASFANREKLPCLPIRHTIRELAGSEEIAQMFLWYECLFVCLFLSKS